MTEPEKQTEEESIYLFPKWSNKVPFYLLTGLTLALVSIVFVFWYWFAPRNFEVGYMPEQPIPYSHRLHAGELGIDCRYCHHDVEESPYANIPATEVCMNCHETIQKDSPEIAKLREAHAKGEPIEWVQIHELPDYAYFNHAAHLDAGVSCVSCHGRVDKMEVVHQVESLSMSFCLECHREPEKHLRPKSEITNLAWHSDDQLEIGKAIKEAYKIYPGEDCNTCHR